MFRLALSLVVVCFALGSGGARADQRVALVIGNGAYSSVGALDNPGRDAEAVAKALRDVGFQTVQVEHDLGHDSLLAALRRFETAVDGADWALVYYAGHGIEVGGVNYLVPTDARMLSDRDVDEEAVSLAQVQKRLEGAHKLRLVILDACRDNPFLARMKRTQSASRSVGRGLAVPDLPQTGSLVAYSAAAGQVAMDGETAEGNSPYSTALVKALAMPDLEVDLFFRKVRGEVLRATDNRQEPTTYASLSEDRYVFHAPASGEPAQAARVAACDRLTASQFDLDRPPSVLPAKYTAIDSGEAVVVCRAGLDGESNKVVLRRLHFELGRALEAGKRLAEAVPEYRASYDAGSAVGAEALARVYAWGIGVKEDDAAAIGFTRDAADRGSVSSMTRLAGFYQTGYGVSKDAGQARAWYLKAAALGGGAAMVGLGGMYLQGDGVPKDAAAGKAWLEKAATTNDSFALTLLGQANLYGMLGIIPVDYAKGRRLCERAATDDNSLAMTCLGDVYSKGLGVSRDLVQARAWYEKAIAAGNPDAKVKLDSLKKG